MYCLKLQVIRSIFALTSISECYGEAIESKQKLPSTANRSWTRWKPGLVITTLNHAPDALL